MNKVDNGLYISDIFTASDEKQLSKNVKYTISIENNPCSKRFGPFNKNKSFIYVHNSQGSIMKFILWTLNVLKYIHISSRV